MPAKVAKPQQKAPAGNANKGKSNDSVYKDKSKPDFVRQSNITAAKAVADAIRTSLGPRGMDKMIEESKGDVTITNDGATILKKMNVLHPTAKMLVELSKSQDIEAGDGTTSVVVLAGSMLVAAGALLDKGIHAGQISESFQFCAARACEILESISSPVDLHDRESLVKIASTSLNSKVVSQSSSVLPPLAVDAVLKVIDKENPNLISLNDIRIVKKLGGTVEDTARVDDLLLNQKAEAKAGVHRVENAKIALIQFCISPPKTDMDNSVIVQEYNQMDRVIKEERQYILNIVKAIKQSECNVLLIQKSILRDSVSDLALHFLSKIKVMTVKDIERDEIEFICRTLGCKPIASVDHFKAENFGYAGCVEELNTGTSKCVKISQIKNPGNTVSILLRGSNKLVLDEADRSLHDALCVVRCLVKKGGQISGGGAPEIELSQRLLQESSSLVGIDQYCMRAFAEALEVIPFTLAENAGLNPIKTVTELRNIHARGQVNAGINVRKGTVTNMLEENVMQPLLVSLSAISLAAETVRQILKIDDVVNVR